MTESVGTHKINVDGVATFHNRKIIATISFRFLVAQMILIAMYTIAR